MGVVDCSSTKLCYRTQGCLAANEFHEQHTSSSKEFRYFPFSNRTIQAQQLIRSQNFIIFTDNNKKKVPSLSINTLHHSNSKRHPIKRQESKAIVSHSTFFRHFLFDLKYFD
jgi:hypothetical protein